MLVTIERHEAVAVLTLNRPEAMNALSRDLRVALAEAICALAVDNTIRVLVLTGAGERAFCAGFDLKELGREGLGTHLAKTAMTDPALALRACAKPVIGAINGVAVTGGFELALCCDMLIASDKARFADTHARVGALPGWGLSQKLSRMIGTGRAKELALSGNYIDAGTAAAWGLVNRVVPAADLLPAAIALAQDIAGTDPAVIAAYKALIDDGYALPYADALKLERERAEARNMAVSHDSVEAVRGKVLERGRDQQV